jgi:hypothetical protein
VFSWIAIYSKKIGNGERPRLRAALAPRLYILMHRQEMRREGIQANRR